MLREELRDDPLGRPQLKVAPERYHEVITAFGEKAALEYPQIAQYTRSLRKAAEAGDKAAKAAYAKLFAIDSPRGAPRTSSIEKMQEDDRRRKRAYDEHVRTTREKLMRSIRTAWEKLLRTVTRDSRQYIAAREQIVDAVLGPYLTSKNAHERKAAEKVKQQIDRQFSLVKR